MAGSIEVLEFSVNLLRKRSRIMWNHGSFNKCTILILEVLRGASILRVFLRNTRRLVIFLYQLLQEYFLLKNHKNKPSFEFLIFRAKL